MKQGFDLESFDGDEFLLLAGSFIICVIGFLAWFNQLRRVSKLGAHPYQRLPVYGAFMVGFAVVALVLWRWADQQIRDNSAYVLLVFLMGGAWLTVSACFFHWLGIGLRHDAFEARNVAASLAVGGAILAVLLIFAAATAGEGPSFWNNVFSGGLATAVFLLLWFIVAVFGHAHVSVAEERDVASGIRFGAFLVAQGLILARAIAGDWHSCGQTVQDLVRDGWVAGPLTMLAVILERVLRPDATKPTLPVMTYGILPAALYIVTAVLWTLHLGWWEGAMK